MAESTYAQLERLTTTWGAIQAENESEKALVSEEDFAAWQRMDLFTVELLEAAIEEYDRLSGRLTTGTSEKLAGLDRSIAGAKRVPRAELEAKLPPAPKAAGLLSHFKR